MLSPTLLSLVTTTVLIRAYSFIHYILSYLSAYSSFLLIFHSFFLLCVSKKKMGRGKVQLKQIENKISRQVTFSKRRTGLSKKAHEISVLCDAQVALIVFNTKGELFDYSSESSMETILEQYEQHAVQTSKLDGVDIESQGKLSLEYHKLNTKIDVIERNLRNFVGHDLDPLSLRELRSLEQQLDTALKRIRTRKNHVMNESISQIHKRAKAVQEQNKNLTKKVEAMFKSTNLGIKDKEKKLDDELPHYLPETLSQNSSTLLNLCPTELQSPERLVLTLALSESLLQARNCSI